MTWNFITKNKNERTTAVKSNGLGKGILPNFLRKFKSLRYICFGLVSWLIATSFSCKTLGNIMKKNSYLIMFLIISSFFSCQEKDIAELYNQCYSEEVTVDGISIKHYIKGFEAELIKSKLLKDSTGKSYRDFCFELSNYDYIVLETKYSFLDSIKGLEYDGVLNCPKKIADHKDYPNTIFGKLGKYMKENNGNHEGFFKSQPIDSIFNEKTFEFDYIKHKFFNMIKVYDKNKYESGTILCNTENCPERKITLY
jgi:hypothetical protein